MALEVVSSKPVGSRDGQVFWTGTDGNIWLRETSGKTTNMGTPQQAQSWNYILNGAREIGDPLPGGAQQQQQDTGLGGGGGLTASSAAAGPVYQDTTAARQGTQTTLDSLDTILNNKLAEADGEYNALLGTYGEEETANAASYTKNREGNENNREAQQQAALLAAANGGRGLNSVLASLGALGGTGKLLANRAVSNEANLDIGQANKTFDTNATNLFDSYGKIKKQEEQRRKDADLTLEKTKQSSRYDTAETRQKLMKDMADLWSKAGNFGEANKWTGDAAKVTSDLVANTRPQVGSYARTPLQYSAPALDSYLAGANDMSVNTSAGSSLPINGAIYTSTKKRET